MTLCWLLILIGGWRAVRTARPKRAVPAGDGSDPGEASSQPPLSIDRG